jgi:hypothetical protein
MSCYLIVRESFRSLLAAGEVHQHQLTQQRPAFWRAVPRAAVAQQQLQHRAHGVIELRWSSQPLALAGAAQPRRLNSATTAPRSLSTLFTCSTACERDESECTALAWVTRSC